VTAGIELRGQEVEPAGVWHVLTAETLQAHNSFTTPDAVRPRGGGPIAAGRRFDLLLPARSVSVIVLRPRAGR
jgi:alpha-L-arabinofuranosidase